jgi:hypothetical protein
MTAETRMARSTRDTPTSGRAAPLILAAALAAAGCGEGSAVRLVVRESGPVVPAQVDTLRITYVYYSGAGQTSWERRFYEVEALPQSVVIHRGGRFDEGVKIWVDGFKGTSWRMALFANAEFPSSGIRNVTVTLSEICLDRCLSPTQFCYEGACAANESSELYPPDAGEDAEVEDVEEEDAVVDEMEAEDIAPEDIAVEDVAPEDLQADEADLLDLADMEGETCVPSPDPSETGCNGVDDDCDGRVDENYVSYVCGLGVCRRNSTCDFGVESCTAGPPLGGETGCNGYDDDCDGSTDEDFVPYYCGIGACMRQSTCSGGIESCTPGDPLAVSDIVCDGLDEDCDGPVDEDYRPYTCGLGVCMRSSACAGGVESCVPGSPTGAETTCNGQDDDCDGATDENYTPYQCGSGLCMTNSTCVGGVESCTPGTGTPEVCDGIDNDCDGEVDEDFDDAYEPNQTCAVGVDLGVVSDAAGGVIDVSGNITNWDDADWFFVSAADDADTTADEWDFQVFFTFNPGGLAMDVLRGSCSSVHGCLAEADCVSLTTNYRSVPGFPYVGENPCGSSTTLNRCENDTSIFYIRVYRTSGSGYCAGYSIRIQNNAATDCPGWVSPTPGSDSCCKSDGGSCRTSCGTTGARTCDSVTCNWGSCVPPVETCNGRDDDCDGSCDEGWTCCAGRLGSCTSSCGTSGTMLCSASCAWGPCTPPAEICNMMDDDCDGTIDEVGGGFACPDGCCNGTETSSTCPADCA